MGAKFCFFTDPALLGQQQPDEAFGPLAAENGLDRFQCTDMHGAAPGAPAVAVCSGQLRAVASADGLSFNIVLKPTRQPALEFPFVSYFIYKGIDPASLFDGDLVKAEGSAPDVELVDLLHRIWRTNDNEGDPDKSVLGLDLMTGDDAASYADGMPIDRLFYGYPAARPPIPVKGGVRIGKFLAQFGFEVMVEQIGRQPRIGWARSVRTIFAAAPLAGTPNPDDAPAFVPWHDLREAVLGFVDPCALWGAAAGSGLSGSEASEAILPADVYAGVLCGAGGEDAAAFVRRNRAYIDVRNEHGQSMNYYRSSSIGDMIRLGFEDQEPDELATLDYYDSGWPCFWIDETELPTLADDAVQLRVQVALPATDYSNPLPYVAVGNLIPAGKPGLRPFLDQERFIDVEAKEGAIFLDPGAIAMRVVPGSPPRLLASYSRISHFKRPLEKAETTPPPLASAPHNLAPVPIKPLDFALPVPGAPVFPASGGQVAVKTFADVVLVSMPSDDGPVFVARPGFAQDALHAYLFLFPVARYRGPSRRRRRSRKPDPPSVVLVDEFFRDFLRKKAGGRFSSRTINPKIGDLATPVEVVRATARKSDFIVVVLDRTDYEPAVLPPSPTRRVLDGTGLMSLALGDILSDLNGQRYVEAAATYSRLTAPVAPPVAGDEILRQTQQPFTTLYGHENP